jgi:hypothetical protein
LVITRVEEKEPEITVDNIEVAQFIYLLLHNEDPRRYRHCYFQGVLILGRFTTERKAVLDALRGELRKPDYLPSIQPLLLEGSSHYLMFKDSISRHHYLV